MAEEQGQQEQDKGEVGAQGWVHSAEWRTPITACAYAVMPNGGKVTMEGTPGHTFEEAVQHLQQTHELYLEWGGWGGGRAIALFFTAQSLLQGLGIV